MIKPSHCPRAAFAARLPAGLKMKVLDQKYLLKLAVKGLVPELIRRRPKQPYRAPDAQSFLVGPKQAKLSEYVEELLSPSAVQAAGIFEPAAVEKLIAKARQGKIVSVQDNMAFVGILSTQVVVDRFIKNFPRSV